MINVDKYIKLDLVVDKDKNKKLYYNDNYVVDETNAV